MPKSKNRKDHKKKVQNYKRDIKCTERRIKEQKIQEYITKMSGIHQNMEDFKTGEDINLTDINTESTIDVSDLVQDANIIDDSILN